MKKIFILMTASIYFLILFCSCGYSEKTSAEKPSAPPQKKANEGKVIVENERKESPKAEILLYFGDETGEMLIPEKRSVKREELLANAPKLIIEELIKGPENSAYIPTVPKGTRLLSVKKDKDTLIVDFSKEFRENHGGGSSGETLTIFSIVNSLTELKDVEKVIFKIEGKLEPEFKGHYEFDKPFSRDENLIKKRL